MLRRHPLISAVVGVAVIQLAFLALALYLAGRDRQAMCGGWKRAQVANYRRSERHPLPGYTAPQLAALHVRLERDIARINATACP